MEKKLTERQEDNRREETKMEARMQTSAGQEEREGGWNERGRQRSKPHRGTRGGERGGRDGEVAGERSASNWLLGSCFHGNALKIKGCGAEALYYTINEALKVQLSSLRLSSSIHASFLCLLLLLSSLSGCCNLRHTCFPLRRSVFLPANHLSFIPSKYFHPFTEKCHKSHLCSFFTPTRERTG